MSAYSSPGSDPVAVPANEGPEPCGDAFTANSASMYLHASAAESAQPAQACPVAETAEQPSQAGSSEPTSANMASQSSTAEPTADEARCFLQPNELRVAAALLVVMKRAQKDGREGMRLMKEILFTNNPITSIFTELMPDDGKLPSMKQLARSATEDLQKALYLLAEQCAETGCKPLDVFTRSAECTTHCTALHITDSTVMAARQRRLQALEASLAISSAAEARDSELHRKLSRVVDPLSQHGASRKTCALIVFILREAVLLHNADQAGEEKDPLMAGSISSFTTCLDHMLPGVLDGLLHHGGDDLTSVPALLKLLPPLGKALHSYRARAASAKRSPAHIVRIEATVQGWPARAPHRTRLMDAIITYLHPRTAVLSAQQAEIASPTASDSTEEVQQAAQPQRVMRQQDIQGFAEPDADANQGTRNEEPAGQGQSLPMVDSAKPQRGLGEAEEAEKMMGKRAREQAARQQATAQVTEAKGEGSKELWPTEDMSSTPEQEQSAGSSVTDELPEATQRSKAAIFPAPEGLPAVSLSAVSSEEVSSCRSSSLSPQPSLAVQGSTQLSLTSEELEADFEMMWEKDTTSRAAPAGPAAQALGLADDQEEEPWQEVSRPKRKPVTQQVAPKSAARNKERRQGRAKPTQPTPAQSPSRPRRAQADSQHAAQAPPKTSPAPRASKQHSRVAVTAGSRDSSLSPQSSTQLDGGRVHRQHAQDMPSRTARAAQAAAQEKQHYRAKRGCRNKKPKQAAPKPGTRRASELRDEVAGSSRSSSRSPQPSAQHDNTSDEQQEFDFTSWPALVAQAPAQAAQEEQPVQAASRPISQEAAPESYASRARRQGRGTPDQTTPDQSPARPRIMHSSAQHAEQASFGPQGSGVHPNAPPLEQLLHRLSVMTKNTPQQPSQQKFPDSQRSFSTEASSSSMQCEPVQKTAGGDAVDQEFAALQQMLRPRPCSESRSHGQAASVAGLADEHELHEDELCVVCMENLRDVITFPCGHMCTCQGCARDIMASAVALCPVCRATIQTTITANF